MGGLDWEGRLDSEAESIRRSIWDRVGALMGPTVGPTLGTYSGTYYGGRDFSAGRRGVLGLNGTCSVARLVRAPVRSLASLVRALTHVAPRFGVGPSGCGGRWLGGKAGGRWLTGVMTAAIVVASVVALSGVALGGGNAMRPRPTDRLANVALGLTALGAFALTCLGLSAVTR